MAISRIPGYSLLPDLDRQGVDLQFTTNGNALVYLDFANFKFGINETVPQEALHVVGNVLVTDSVLGLANLSQNLGSETVWWNNIYSNTAVVTSISAGTLEGTLTTAAQPNVTSLGNLTLLNVDGLLTAGNITTGNIAGTLITGIQPYISNLANVEVENLSIIGTLATGGNIVTEAVFAEEIYEANTRVLTANSNIQISGDATGYGTYNNVAITLADTGVVAGVYGSGDDEFVDHVPKITVDSKGRITNIANVTLTQVGNVTFTDTTISTTSNITIAPQNGFIFANNSIVTDVADPVNAQDVVTLNYLNTQLGSAANNLFADDSILALWDDGVNPGYVELTLDGNVALNYSAALAQINSLAVNIGTLQFSGNTISSPGNITLDAQGSGIIQVSGADAFGLPYGNNAQRPNDPELGYFRYNSELSDIEWWNGNVWQTTQGGITSEVITPDGSNVAYTLTQNVTDENSVLVSINGTLQQPLESYTVSGNVITFAETPLTTDTIEVRIISGSLSTVVGVATQLLIGNSAVIPNGIDIEITGNLIPSANLVYSLGDNTHRWKDLYVSGNTIYIGDTTISASGSNLLIGGNPVAAVSTYGNANVAVYLPTHSGNISGDYITANVINTTGTQGTGNISGVNSLSAISINTVGNIVTGGIKTNNYYFANGVPVTFSSYGNNDVQSYLTTNSIGPYSNTNVASYLTTYNGIIGGNIVIGKDLTVTGNLSIVGNTVNFNTNNLTVNDSIIELHYHGGNVYTSDDGRDIGIRYHYYKSGNNDNAFLGWANNTGYLEWYGSGVTESNAATITGNYGTFKTGNLLLLSNANVAGSVRANTISTGRLPTTTLDIYSESNSSILISDNTINQQLYYDTSLGQLSIEGDTAEIFVQSYFQRPALYLQGPDIPTVYLYSEETTNGSYGRIFGGTLGSQGSQIRFITSNVSLDYTDIAFLTSRAGLGTTEKLRITSTGNVGIGTNNATSTLHVIGTANITSNITTSGIVTNNYFYANGQSIFTNIDTSLSTLSANAAAQAGLLSGLEANAAAQAGAISAITSYSNTLVSSYLPTHSGNIGGQFVGNVRTNNYFYANGVAVTFGGGSSYGNTQVAQYLPTYTGNIANIRIGVSGNITFADGSSLNSANTLVTVSGTQTLENKTFIDSSTEFRYAMLDTMRFKFSAANCPPGSTVSLSVPDTSGTIVIREATVWGNTVVGNLKSTGGIIAGDTLGTSGQYLQSTGTGIQWVSGTSGNAISNGTSNVAVLSSGGNVVVAVGGNIEANIGSSGMWVGGNVQVTHSYFIGSTLLANISGGAVAIGAANTSINLGDGTFGCVIVRSTLNTSRYVTALIVNGGATVAGNLWVDGSIQDGKGDVRDLVNNGQNADYILTSSDSGKMINITSGNVTVNSSVFSAGNNITIFNNAATSRNIIQGSSVTMYLAGTANTGNRVLSQRGIATIVCVAANTFVISGAGIS